MNQGPTIKGNGSNNHNLNTISAEKKNNMRMKVNNGRQNGTHHASIIN